MVPVASAPSVSVIPQQVRFAGLLPNRTGDTVEAVFRIYAAAEGGEPLWTETQKISIAQDGSYSALLGAASSKGLPQTVFSNGQARWVGVTVERGEEETRIPLTSAPYAMKAGDAETLGGLSPRSFVTQAQLAAAAQSLAAQATQQITPMATTAVTGTGVTNYIPVWTSASNLADSVLYQSSSKIGIGTTAPAAALHVVGPSAGTVGMVLQSGGGAGSLKVGADVNASTLTASVRKLARIAMPDWANDSQSVLMFSGDIPNATNNDMYLGGATGSPLYGPTTLHFFTSPNSTTVGGTEKMTITSTGNIGIGAKNPVAKLEVNGTAKFDGNITFATTQSFPGPTGAPGPPGPAGVSFWAATTLLQPFTTNVTQYGAAIGSSNSTLDTDYYGKYRLALIFPKACTASNFAVNLGYESITFPFDLTTALRVNGTVTPLSCVTGFDTNVPFSCTSTGTYPIAVNSEVILEFDHTGTNPSNIYPQVTFQCN